MRIVPVTLKEAKVWINRIHRRHRAPQGGFFAVGMVRCWEIVGIAVVGRPFNWNLDDGWTVEVTRGAVLDGQPNACSKLYAVCWRIAREMGYREAVTYTLEDESGASLRGAGWRCIGRVSGSSWNRPSRPRVDTHPLQAKFRWETP